MKQYSQRYELKNRAKDSLLGKYTGAILICLLQIILFAIGMSVRGSFTVPMNGLLTSESHPTSGLLIYYIFFTALSLIFSALLGVMQAGLSLYFLKTACGQTAYISDLFWGYTHNFQKFLTISFINALLNTVCATPVQLFGDLYRSTLSRGWFIAAMAAAVIGLILYLPINLGIFLSYFLVLDFPDKSAGEIIKLSISTMKGHKTRLFFLQLSFLPLMLLCVLTLYVCFLWLVPYMKMTYALFFLDLMNPTEPADSAETSYHAESNLTE